MEKSLGIGIIGLGMGRDLLYVNKDPTTQSRSRKLGERRTEHERNIKRTRQGQKASRRQG